MKDIFIDGKESYDKQILSLLGNCRGLSPGIISDLLDIPAPRIVKVLASLERFDRIRKSTISKSTFYRIKKKGAV